MDIWIVVRRDMLLGKKAFPRKEMGQNWAKDQKLSGSSREGCNILWVICLVLAFLSHVPCMLAWSGRFLDFIVG